MIKKNYTNWTTVILINDAGTYDKLVDYGNSKQTDINMLLPSERRARCDPAIIASRNGNRDVGFNKSLPVRIDFEGGCGVKIVSCSFRRATRWKCCIIAQFLHFQDWSVEGELGTRARNKTCDLLVLLERVSF